MMKPLTKNQAAVLNYAWHFYLENDQLPSRQSIANYFGWRSANSAEEVLQVLFRRGLLVVNALGKFKFTALSRQTLEHGDWVGEQTIICEKLVEKALEQLAARKPVTSIFSVGAG